MLGRVCTLAGSYLGLTLTIGVGAPCQQLGGLAQSAAGARAALDYRAFVGRGRAIWSLRAASVSPLTNLTSTRLLPL